MPQRYRLLKFIVHDVTTRQTSRGTSYKALAQAKDGTTYFFNAAAFKPGYIMDDFQPGDRITASIQNYSSDRYHYASLTCVSKYPSRRRRGRASPEVTSASSSTNDRSPRPSRHSKAKSHRRRRDSSSSAPDARRSRAKSHRRRRDSSSSASDARRSKATDTSSPP
jgi:hypothetical protein